VQGHAVLEIGIPHGRSGEGGDYHLDGARIRFEDDAARARLHEIRVDKDVLVQRLGAHVRQIDEGSVDRDARLLPLVG
jgi:hypothetical protein